nr:MAG TPA: hypothetical protein [Caudoviricetes sp.]
MNFCNFNSTTYFFCCQYLCSFFLNFFYLLLELLFK